MGKLKHAPLLEVIFELKWLMNEREDWEKFPYLHGDLFSRLKETYPIRQLLTPPEIPPEMLISKPIYRFAAKEGYPLFQVGPGLITLNTTGEQYEWEHYYKRIIELLQHLLEVHLFTEEKKIIPSLSYFDFFPVDWENIDIFSFINENLNIYIEQSFEIDKYLIK